jgi:hypothetical protein
MINALVPIFVCVVLPVSIVLIVFLTGINSDNKRAKVLIKAIENNNAIDANKLVEALKKQNKSAQEILNLRLLRGCIFLFIGLALTIVSIIGLISGTHFEADPVAIPMLFGGISLAIGLSYITVYFVTRKQINK